MSYPNLANGWTSTLSGAIDTDDTTVDVAATAGMPSRPFQAVILAEGANSDEIVTVTNLSSSTITITRATEANAAGSSSASSHASGATISQVLTAGSLADVVSDTVQVQSGYGSIIIPGLAGDGARQPGSPNGNDREFDTATLGGAAVGTATTESAHTTRPSHYYIKKTGTGSTVLVTGRAWSWSPSNGDTVTAYQRWFWEGAGQTSRSGLFVGEATPGKMDSIGWGSSTAFGIYCDAWTDPTTYNSTSGSFQMVQSPVQFMIPLFVRVVYNNSTSIDLKFSIDGFIWQTIVTGRNPGYTVGSFGLMVEPTTAIDAEAMFDWVRVNWTP